MKNENMPLIQALRGRVKSKPEPSFDQFKPSRTFQIDHSEVPGLPGRAVGDHISVNLHGKIHSQSADGHAIMHVSSVKPDTEEGTKKEYPEQKTPSESGALVRTQESHCP